MGSLGDAVVTFPLSGSYNPYSHMRSVMQARSSSLSVLTCSIASQLLVPENSNRVGLILRNTSPAHAYVKYGGGPIDTNVWSFQVLAGGTLGNTSSPISYIGQIHVIWDSSVAASGSMKITELF